MQSPSDLVQTLDSVRIELIPRPRWGWRGFTVVLWGVATVAELARAAPLVEQLARADRGVRQMVLDAEERARVEALQQLVSWGWWDAVGLGFAVLCLQVGLCLGPMAWRRQRVRIGVDRLGIDLDGRRVRWVRVASVDLLGGRPEIRLRSGRRRRVAPVKTQPRLTEPGQKLATRMLLVRDGPEHDPEARAMLESWLGSGE